MLRFACLSAGRGRHRHPMLLRNQPKPLVLLEAPQKLLAMPHSIRRTGMRKSTIVENIAATPLAVERKEIMIEHPVRNFQRASRPQGSSSHPQKRCP